MYIFMYKTKTNFISWNNTLPYLLRGINTEIVFYYIYSILSIKKILQWLTACILCPITDL